MKLSQSKTYEAIKLFIAVLLSAAVTCVFFGQTLVPDGLYPSDTISHITLGIQGTGYGLETLFIHFISKFVHAPFLNLIFACIQTVFVLLTWMISQKFIDKYFSVSKWTNLSISTGAVFLATIYIPILFPYFYNYSLGTQPWHSSTQLSMKFGAVVFLYYFFDVYPTYYDGFSRKAWIHMAGWLMVTTMFKPNFLMTFCPAFGIILLRDYFQHRTKTERKTILRFFSIVFPSIAVMVFQYFLLYIRGNPDSSSGVRFVFFSNLVWEGSVLHMVLKIAEAFAFPFLVCCIPSLLDKGRGVSGHTVAAGTVVNIRFSVLMYISALLIASLFAETGSRAAHGNFGWGIYVAYYTLFLNIVPFFFQTVESYQERCRMKGERIAVLDVLIALCFILLFWHLCSGLYYFIHIAYGGDYYI